LAWPLPPGTLSYVSELAKIPQGVVERGEDDRHPVPPPAPTSPLVDALVHLRADLDTVSLTHSAPGADAARTLHVAVKHQIDDYLLPRLSRVDAPLLVVVGGSTGAGKSTIVNSLLRADVTRAGVLRPTTRAPVLVHHPADARWFTGTRVMPGLARVHGADEVLAPGEPITTMRLVASEGLPAGLALLDAPDIDSVVESNRMLAGQLLAAADLWLFVTTAARYADAVPWELLNEAAARSAALCLVLNRVPAEAVTIVRDDLAGLLSANGLGTSPIFAISEGPTESGLLPRRSIGPLQSWLTALASDSAARGVVIRRTVTGALTVLGDRVRTLASAADDQAAAVQRLRALAVERYEAGADGFAAAMRDGTMLRGEVLARWQEVVGTGEFMRSVESGIGRARDRVVAFLRGKPSSTEQLGEALGNSTEALVLAEVTAAAGDLARRWRSDAVGAEVLATHSELGIPAPDVDTRIQRLVRDWQGTVLGLVREQGEGKRMTARALSFGVNGAGVALMLVVFSQTAGVSGAEIGIAAGTAALSQRLLEAVFGDQAVRNLAAAAQNDLLERVRSLLETERTRWDEALPPVASGDALRGALDALERTR